MARPTASRGGGAGEDAHIREVHRAIYTVVRRIPRGRVVTYGQVAELAGIPGRARLAGAAMRASPRKLGLPWHRVVGKRSKTLAQVNILDPIGSAVQRHLLEEEGVKLSDSGGIRLADYGWLPDVDGR
ncbi:MAG TPA: methylated-DNA--[protein]-cysteine S-methyltransferase [Kofleriaceae bacterium]|nr:methylated-DNA--[protein]-cysteine S-methyltransferase [Kofleriaceae bacterium]